MKGALDIPRRLRQRPRDRRGYPIPYTVVILPSGEPDFRASEPERWLTCVQRGICALCGQELLSNAWWFVGGPPCEENRLFLDPAMHRECAEFALCTCPFLAMPKAHYSNLERRPPPAGFADTQLQGPDKPDRFMLGRAVRAGLYRHRFDVSPAIKASPWLEVYWWKDGKELPG